MLRPGFLPAFLLLVLLSGRAEGESFLEQDMCVRCHLLADNPAGGNPVLSWRKSVHFRPDTACADCHGGDKNFYADFQAGHLGLPPGRESLKICEKCHPRETAPFSDPPPQPAKCTAVCYDCHAYHETAAATTALINENTCGRCHAFTVVLPAKKALETAEAKMAGLEREIERRRARGFPVVGLRRDLAALQAEFAALFHEKPPGRWAAAAETFLGPLGDFESRLEGSAPYRWYVSGAVVVAFLAAVIALLAGYQSAVRANFSGKEEREMSQEKGNSSDNGTVGGEPRRGSPWTGRLALLFSLVALGIALQEKFAATDKAVRSLNRTVSKTLVPELKKANDRAAVNSVYELKRMVVTLDELRETNPDREIQARIDRIKSELQELSVKFLVQE